MSAASIKDFLKRKNVSITVQTYLIDALGAMAFGLFASLLIGTIFGTLGQQFHIEIFNVIIVFCPALSIGAAFIIIRTAPHRELPDRARAPRSLNRRSTPSRIAAPRQQCCAPPIGAGTPTHSVPLGAFAP